MARRKYIALRYLTRFHCIGGECEETCCGGWRVDVDEGHFQKLKRAMKAPAERARFEAMMAIEPPPTRTRYKFAVLRDGDNGLCRALGADGWCDIHRSHGPDVLPLTCAQYPRHQITVGDRVEASANLSCPEVARLALLADDAVDLVESDARILPRNDEREMLARPQTAALPWVRHLDDVRGTALELLMAGQFPIASRLLHVASMAYALASFYTPEAEEVDAREVNRLLDAAGELAMCERLHMELGSAPPSELGALVVTNVILGTRTGPLRATYAANLDAATAGCSDGDGRLARALVYTTHVARRERLPIELRDRMERYFENFHRHMWMRDCYIPAPDLFAYAQNAIVRHCLLRFLLIGHPLTAASMEEPDHDKRLALFDRAAVSVFYTYSRAMEHNADIWKSITADMKDHKLQSLAHCLHLLKF